MRKNLLKIGLVATIVAVLAVVIGIPVSADASTTTTTPKPALHTIQGAVQSISGTTSFAILNGNKQSVTITVDTNTKYYLVPMGGVRNYVNNQVSKDIRQDKNHPSIASTMKELHIPANWRDNLGWLDTFNKSASFSDIAVGDRIIARVDSNNLAAEVLILKGPVIKQTRGTITISGNTLIVTVTGSTTQLTLTWDANTEFIMKGTLTPSGQYGVVTYNSATNPGTAQLVNFTAKPPTTTTTTTTSS